MIAYLDSSALVKLVVEEPESSALSRELLEWPERASSALARVEVVRAAREDSADALRKARQVIANVPLVAVDHAILDAAALIGPLTLRSLDAIHLASASSLGEALGPVITYDGRMLAAAQAANMRILSPA